MKTILGISAYYHDSAAALLQDGLITKAIQEERFSRQKNDADFPLQAIQYCLSDVSIQDLDAVVFYEKPFLKFERLLENYLHFAPRGFAQFRRAMPVWLKQKLFIKQQIRSELADVFGVKKSQLPPLLFAQHHQSHGASAYFCSPFRDAAVLCNDGVGEWATTSAWRGEGTELKPLWQVNYPHSLGLLYSAMTYYCGFEVNNGEYKLMGLAPYGESKFTDIIEQHLIDVKEDGTFRLNLDYFDYTTGDRMINAAFRDLFGRNERDPETPLTQMDMDLAASIQKVTQDTVLKQAQTLKTETNARNLCLAGGVSLNCVANGVVRRSGLFDDVWAQPAAGDAGGAIGAALCAYYGEVEDDAGMALTTPYLGPEYPSSDIDAFMQSVDLPFEQVDDAELANHVTQLLTSGNVIGWFQGRSEFGPRALGSRSILGDPRNPEMQRTMNLKIKNRESFRPFAPVVMQDHVAEWFGEAFVSPYMSFIEPISLNKRLEPETSRQGIQRVDEIRSDVPAITHLDYTARPQTVSPTSNPKLYQLLQAFYAETSCPMLINTSFNVRDEPIVESPEDAWRCFMATAMDVLVIGNYVIRKPSKQKADA